MDAIGELTGAATRAFAEGRVVAAMFADVAGAYNSIEPALLIGRLRTAGGAPEGPGVCTGSHDRPGPVRHVRGAGHRPQVYRQRSRQSCAKTCPRG